MKCNFLLSLLLLLSQVAQSVASDTTNALMVHRPNGQNVTILLDELPVVTFSHNDLVITTHMNTVSYPAQDVARFTYVTVDPDGIDNPSTFGTSFTLNQNSLNVRNMKPSSSIHGTWVLFNVLIIS